MAYHFAALACGMSPGSGGLELEAWALELDACILNNVFACGFVIRPAFLRDHRKRSHFLT